MNYVSSLVYYIIKYSVTYTGDLVSSDSFAVTRNSFI